jgi:hypothetical protein
MIPAKGKGELAEVCRGKLVDSRHIQALDETLTRIVVKELDGDHIAVSIAGYRAIEWVCAEEQLRDVS